MFAQTSPNDLRHPCPIAFQHQRPVPAVAGEKVISPRAGEQDLHSMLPGKLADVEHIQWRRVGEWLVQLKHHALEVGRHG